MRGCLGNIVMDQGRYAGDDDVWKMHPGLVETREMSLLGAANNMHEKWDGKLEGGLGYDLGLGCREGGFLL